MEQHSAEIYVALKHFDQSAKALAKRAQEVAKEINAAAWSFAVIGAAAEKQIGYTPDRGYTVGSRKAYECQVRRTNYRKNKILQRVRPAFRMAETGGIKMEMYEAMTRVQSMAVAYKCACGEGMEGADAEALAIVKAAAEKEIPYRPKAENYGGAKCYICKCGNRIFTKVNSRCHYCGQALKW